MLIAGVLGIVAWFLKHPGDLKIPTGPETPARGVSKASVPSGSAGAPAVEAGILPWSLAAPLSREVVLSGGGGDVLIFGGLTSGGRSARGIYSLDTTNGRLTLVGNLATPLHDASGVRFGNRYLIFGGGSPNTVDSVESVEGTANGQRQQRGRFFGRLPRPRSDSAAVVIGNAVYVLGGYSGTKLSKADSAVLVSADGSQFTRLAELPVPVRYPAVAAAGGLIYLFGGLGAGGAPVSAVQVINPKKGSAHLVGKLPLPLEGASAAVAGGRIYLAGGATSESAAAAAGYAAARSGSHLVTVATVWSFDRNSNSFAAAGRLPMPVANGAAAVVGNRIWLVGGEYEGTPVSAVQMFTPNRGFGVAGRPGAGSPYHGGRLLVADRGNNRLLLLDDSDRIVWRYPSPSEPPPPNGFYFPDDAFFVRGGKSIISNQEQNDTIVEIGFPSGKVLWSYGHPGKRGSAPGYLYEPDDAYRLPGGRVAVADAYNCRVLIINKNGSTAGQIGTTGLCRHDPPAGLGEPNGATPLSNGDFLISEIRGSWISEYTPAGKLVWDVQLPIAYPSDPQQIGPDRYLVADYTKPGGVVEFNRAGKILYRYRPRSGPGMLDHPSLVELLPSGTFMINDDYNDRMVAIDPRTGALVWQYGASGRAGRAVGLLSKPDGFDLLMPDGTTPTHIQG